MKPYYNTNNLDSKELEASSEKNISQEELVKDIFKENQINLTPSQVLKIYKDKVKNKTPLTSIRRAMTNLCYKKSLFKTEKMEIGIYGKPEHLYSLKFN